MKSTQEWLCIATKLMVALLFWRNLAQWWGCQPCTWRHFKAMTKLQANVFCFSKKEKNQNWKFLLLLIIDWKFLLLLIIDSFTVSWESNSEWFAVFTVFWESNSEWFVSFSFLLSWWSEQKYLAHNQTTEYNFAVFSSLQYFLIHDDIHAAVQRTIYRLLRRIYF